MRRGWLGLLLLGIGCSQPELRASPLKVTLGKLEPSDFVCTKERERDCAGLEQASTSPKMRAQAAKGEGDEAELEFLYLGPTVEVAPLASGERRRQLGLKLRAQDSCNVLYVMWRIEPKPGLYVSRKANPGIHAHAACGTSGYRTLRAPLRVPLPELAVGARHRLRARVDGRKLRVWVDGALAWEGVLDEAVLGFDGPIGIRSDNVRFAFRLRGR